VPPHQQGVAWSSLGGTRLNTCQGEVVLDGISAKIFKVFCERFQHFLRTFSRFSKQVLGHFAKLTIAHQYQYQEFPQNWAG
jgi:hypothetical protein